MNNKGQQGLLIGFSLLMVFFVILLVTFSTIEPFKESLDEVRGNVNLNCPGTPNHNASDYADDNDFERLTRRPTCFVTGINMVYFIVVVLISSVAWVVRNWRKT